MSAYVIDGKAIAAELGGRIAGAVERLRTEHGITPHLAVVLVGHDPASETYVRNKTAKTAAAGMRTSLHRLSETVAESDLVALVTQLNADPDIHGVLVQLPLPPQIDARNVVAAIAPAKDVDGCHPLSAGLLATGMPGIRPCTPLACIRLAKTVHASLVGIEAVIIGRSNLVGKPLAHLLLAEDATVTVAHSKTHDLAAVARRADLLFVAVGRAALVTRDFVKPGATVIDVGISRIAAEGGRTRLAGDVAFAQVQDIAGAITPVPGGVGPMTIACLMLNTVRATCTAAGLSAPEI